MRFSLLLLSFITVFSSSTFAQKKERVQIYHCNYKWEIPTVVAGIFVGEEGLRRVREKDFLTEEDVIHLVPEDIWRLDRIATKQDPGIREKVLHRSDIMMQVGIISPGLLFIDKDINDRWWDVTLMAAETFMMNTFSYIAVARNVHRKRPAVYNADMPLIDRLGHNNTNSFFSGHTSTFASSTFFLAKVYHDYHPEMNNAWMLYTGAGIASAYMGYLRVRGGKHFPTDVLMGGLVGAFWGIFVPEFHKRRYEKLKLTPVVSTFYRGMHLTYSF